MANYIEPAREPIGTTGMTRRCETCRHWERHNAERGRCWYANRALWPAGVPERLPLYLSTTADDSCEAHQYRKDSRVAKRKVAMVKRIRAWREWRKRNGDQ